MEQLGRGFPGDKDIAQRWTCQWTGWKREDKNEMAEYKIKGARNEWQRSARVVATMETRLSGLSNHCSALIPRYTNGMWNLKVFCQSKVKSSSN